MPDILFRVNGSIVPRVRFPNVSIHDVIGAQPNTGELTIDTTRPAVGEAIAIGWGSFDPADLLFAGQVQELVETYQSRPLPALTEWPCTLIDHTFALNRRRPFGSFVDVSATTIAHTIIATYGAGFTSVNVQAGLPNVSINFDGSEPLLSCLNNLAIAINGRCKVDYSRDVHLFLPPEAGAVVHTLDKDHRPLNSPPIQFTIDLSQVRTRVYGKGYGATTPTDLLAGETLIPLSDVATFEATGGHIIAGETAEGAQTHVYPYTATVDIDPGTIAGPGAAPTVAPVVTPDGGTGLGTGVYKYAYTAVSASGETLPSPLATITTGPIANTSTVLTATPDAGTGVDLGTSCIYGVTFVVAGGGETIITVSSSAVTSHDVAPPTVGPTIAESGGLGSSWVIGDTIYIVVTYRNAVGETTAGPASNVLVATAADALNAKAITISNIPVSSDPTVTEKRVYMNRNGSFPGPFIVISNATTSVLFTGGSGASPPGTNGAQCRLIRLTNIPIGPPGTVARKVYRYLGGVFKLQQTISNNTADTSTDQTLNAALGANAPSTNTATLNVVAVSGIAVGPSGATGRRIYRTAVGGSQLKYLSIISNNTATVLGQDSVADGLLGANAPTSDTSGLTSTAGQILPGATTLLTAGLGAWPTAGWVRTGQQYIRYSGVAGNTLTGIPATGPGAIVTAITYGNQIQLAPTLTGVNGGTGISAAMARGAKVHIWVQRDDLAAQAALGLLERNPDGTPTDGIREYLESDERRGADSLADLCDASLARFAAPIVGLRYDTLELTRAGETVVTDLMSLPAVFNPAVFNKAVFNTGIGFGYDGEYLIQAVTISILPAAPAGLPRFSVEASSAKFSFADLLQRVLVR